MPSASDALRSGAVSQALLLAAGRGTRMSPVTDHTPKPLLPFLEGTLLDHAAAHAVRAGARRVAVNAHHLGGQVERHVRGVLALRHPEVAWHVSIEEPLLGTGGALRKLRDEGWLEDASLLVVNSDAVFTEDLRAFLAAWRVSGADAAWLVTRGPDSDRDLRTVVGDDTGHLTSISPAPVPAGLVFCGVHVTSPGLFAVLPDGPSCVVRQGYLPWTAAGARVLLHETRAFWADTGTPERYVEAWRHALGDPSAFAPPGP